MILKPVAGRAYFTPGSYSTLLTVANTFYAVPFRAERNMFADRIGIRVSTAGAGSSPAPAARLAIYADDNGRPGSLIQDFGAMAVGTSTGEIKVDISPSLFFWGGPIFWLASVFNAAETTQPTVAALDSGVTPQVNAHALGVVDISVLPISAATAGVAVSGSLTYGAFPATAPTNTVILNGKAPLVGLRAA